MMSLLRNDIIAERSRVGRLALKSENIQLEGPRFSRVWPKSSDESRVSLWVRSCASSHGHVPS
jgi:hypothetical protein